MKHERSGSVPVRAHEGIAAAALVAATVLPAVLLPACAASSAGGAGGASPGPPGSASVEWAGLRFRFSLLPSPADRIRLRAEVTNVSGHVREAELPWCLVQARLYRDGALAFDQAEARGCDEAVRVLRLSDGRSREFWSTLTAEEVLGDSLRPGPFEVRTRLPRNSGRGPPRAEMEFFLGTVELERPQGVRSGS